MALVVGLFAAAILLASCSTGGENTADPAPEFEPAPGIERVAEPEPAESEPEPEIEASTSDCDVAPTTLVDAVVAAEGPDCLAAPATITADAAGTLDLLLGDASGTCTVDVLNSGGSTVRSLSLDGYSVVVLGTGEGVTLSDDTGAPCQFQLGWTPLQIVTTTTAAPTTTSTTTTTTTTTQRPTPPPTTTSAVGS